MKQISYRELLANGSNLSKEVASMPEVDIASLLNEAADDVYEDDNFETDELSPLPAKAGSSGNLEALRRASKLVDDAQKEETARALKIADTTGKEKIEDQKRTNRLMNEEEEDDLAMEMVNAQRLAEGDSDDEDDVDPDEKRRFFICCKEGDMRGVEGFLRRGFQPALRDSHGWNAVHWAASKGKEEVARALLYSAKNKGDRLTILRMKVCDLIL